jgi:hypothetical protein
LQATLGEHAQNRHDALRVGTASEVGVFGILRAPGRPAAG